MSKSYYSLGLMSGTSMDGVDASIIQTENLQVNSFHNNIIKLENLGKNLKPFAVANDYTIEGFYHTKLPMFGVMWHPERNLNDKNELIIRKIFYEKINF